MVSADFDDGVEKWAPDYVLIASSEGFDTDALELAKKHEIGVFEAQETGFKQLVKPQKLTPIF